MKTLTSLILTALLLNLSSCGKQDNPAPYEELHSAVFTGDLDAIRKYIASGRDLNVLEPTHSSTPLISAAYLGNTEAAKLLINAGAELNHKNIDGSTALHTATAFGHTGVARELIGAGAELNYKNNDGSTALHTAAFFCRVEIVEALLEKGADKTLENKTGNTALEIVEFPFEDIIAIYEDVEVEFKPLGLKLDYDHIKISRPKIAEMLK